MKFAFNPMFRGSLYSGRLIFEGKFMLVIRGLYSGGLYSGFYDILINLKLHFPVVEMTMMMIVKTLFILMTTINTTPTNSRRQSLTKTDHSLCSTSILLLP